MSMLILFLLLTEVLVGFSEERRILLEKQRIKKEMERREMERQEKLRLEAIRKQKEEEKRRKAGT